MKCRLDDGILLCVERAQTVTVDHQVPDVIAVRQAPGRSIITGGEYAPILDNDGTHPGPVAGAALGHLEGDPHEVLIPRRSLSLFCHVVSPPLLPCANDVSR